MNWHKKKKYQCKKCLASFDKMRKLKSHLKDKHGCTPSGLKCPNCRNEMIMDYAGEREQCIFCHWKEPNV